jgi:hypothetical protein
VHHLPREVLRKRDHHRTSTKFWLGVIRWVHELGKWPSYMEHSSVWETNSLSANQEIPCLLWDPKVHYIVHKSPSRVPLLIQMNPFHIITRSFSKVILILSSQLCLCLTSGFFLQVSEQNFMCISCLSHMFSYTPFLKWLNYCACIFMSQKTNMRHVYACFIVINFCAPTYQWDFCSFGVETFANTGINNWQLLVSNFSWLRLIHFIFSVNTKGGTLLWRC